MESYTPVLKQVLRSAGCFPERKGKGDHEIWYSPITTGIKFVVFLRVLRALRGESLLCFLIFWSLSVSSVLSVVSHFLLSLSSSFVFVF